MIDEDKGRIIKIIDFMDDEIGDLKKKFLALDFKTYQNEKDIRRSLERCIENIVNSSLDIAKILLIDEDVVIPSTYREYFHSLYAKDWITEEEAYTLAEGVKIRNMLAHHYLDIKWESIKGFLTLHWEIYEEFSKKVKTKLMQGLVPGQA